MLKFFKRKKKIMPENKPLVSFELHGDALNPHPAPWGFIVRNPVEKFCMKNSSILVNTGVACSHHVLVMPRAENENFVKVKTIFRPGEIICFEIVNSSLSMHISVGDGEPVLDIYPLVYNHGV